MALSTIYLYRLAFPNDTALDATITQALNVATAYIENYCDRLFERANYTEYHDGYGENRIYVKQYPIISVSNVAYNLTDVISVTPTENNVYSVTYTSNDSAIVLTTNYSNAASYTNTFTFASYPTMDDINTAINNITNVSSEVISTYVNDPTYLLRPLNGIIRDGNTEWLGYYRQDNYMSWVIDPETDNVLYTSCGLPSGIKNIFIKYTAGYIYPVDNVGHTALDVAGTVPTDLTNLCNRLTSSIIGDMATGSTNYSLQSERLGDYSYSIVTYNGIPQSTIEAFYLSYKGILDKYKRKNLTW